MLRRVLIANRGEIALRVLRACRELGIETVAVYSQADADALHVQLAGQAVCIGPARAADSYLNQDALLTVAKATGCDGVHPGYGFLSENADFADLCVREGITFIGPSGDTIRKAGSKSAARDLMRAAGVPVTPGSDGPVASVEEALTAAESVGYPVLLKASAGATGRRICPRPLRRPRQRPRPASAMTRCIWRSWCSGPGTSSSRCWRTATATSSILESGTAPSSGTIRR